MAFCGAKGRARRIKEEAVMKNGRMLLEKLVAFDERNRNPIRNFSAEELEIATNNYDSRRVVTQDSLYALYWGFLLDKPVSVKKFKEKSGQYAYCFKDIVFSSRMSNHKNFLKLLGCCLETRVPVLVFEVVKEQNLADRIYGYRRDFFGPLPWEHRLKIAMEMANAVSYLHTAFPEPIVFRNIKPLNILFDEDGVAKLSDFSISISIPKGKTHAHDPLLIGAQGLIAPEYITEGTFNEKQDVFNFGVFLLVLLTGQMAADNSRIEHGGECFLISHVQKHVVDNSFNLLVDPVIASEHNWPGLQALFSLALSCASTIESDRPTMIDVAKEIRQLYRPATSSEHVST